jgi:hypothetical protein
VTSRTPGAMRSANSLLNGAIRLLASPAGLVAFSTLLLLAWFLTDLSADPDLFARLAVGRLIEGLGYVPLDDPFSFAPKNPAWIDHEWLAGVVFHRTWSWFGEPGLFVLKLVFVVLSLAALERAQRLWAPDRSERTAWFVALAVGSAVVWRSTVRAQIFTYLGIPLCLLAFAEYRVLGRGRLLLLLPVYFLLWTNAHGGFVVGLGFLGIFAVAESLRRGRLAPAAWIALVGSFAATFVNPYPGLSYWEYVLHAVTLTRSHVAEWRSVSPLSHTAILPLLVLLVTVLGWLIGPRPDLLTVSLLAVSFYYGMRHERLVPIFLMCAAVVGAPAWSAAFRAGWNRLPEARRSGLVEATALVAVCVAVAAVLFSLAATASSRLRLRYDEYPVAAIDWILANRGRGRVVTSFNAGSYALWRLHPRFQIAIDGRYEALYPDSTMQVVMDLYWGAESEQRAALGLLSPDLIIVEKTAVSSGQRETFARWGSRVYADEAYETWERAPSP